MTHQALSVILMLTIVSLAVSQLLEPTTYVGTSLKVRIAVYENNPERTPTVVFLHGNSLSSQIFQRQYYGLKNYHTLFLDLPGCGRSQNGLTNDVYSITNMTQIVLDVIKHFDVEDCYLVGHSLGGVIAIEASQYLPKLKGLALLAGPALPLPLSSNPFVFSSSPSVPLLFTPTLTSAQAKELADSNFAVGFLYPSFVIEDIQDTSPGFRPTVGLSVQTGNYSDQYAILGNLKAKVGMLVGDSDQLLNVTTFVTTQAAAVKNLFQKKVTVIERVGHTPSVEDWQAVNSFITSFVGRGGFVQTSSSGAIVDESTVENQTSNDSSDSSPASSLISSVLFTILLAFVLAF
eukprot:TRINITY_DN982_c0_g1_i1.p1 TRINITY_DN982_c0_g1~~TRINITY_DN982_c0_g1_i1.p1  ORF type:complete len:374 (-),score=138.79 TRINITY_DN982_c0_g1_i1:41-1081(-)